MSVGVVTDSSAVIPKPWLECSALHVVPLQIAWEDGELSSGDMPYAELAARLARGARPPKTAAPSPGVYEQIFSHLLESDEALLVICPAAEFSTTYANATLAANSVSENRVRVLDPRTAAAGQGIVAYEAALAAGGGLGPDAVLARASDVANRVQIWATLAQLEFLRHSGRLPAIAAIGAGALRLQPIIRYAHGSPAPVGVTRSTKRGAERLFRAWERSLVPGATLRLVAFHSARHNDAGGLRQRVLNRLPDADAHAVEVTASLAAHTGPGLLGLAWVWGQ